MFAADSFRARSRAGASLLALGCSLLLAPAASAETVRYLFTGVVTQISGWPDPMQLDLHETISPGQPIAIVFSVGRPVATCENELAMTYYGVLDELSFSFGSYGATATAPACASGGVAISNGASFSPDDFFYVQTSVSTAPAIGTARLSEFSVMLRDHDATVFPDTKLPNALPRLEEFEDATCQLQFTDGTNWAFVEGRISTATTSTTPASLTTWGRVKSSYRD